MGGPIVRTGTTPAFWNNWEKAFGKGKKPKTGAAKETAGTEASKAKKAAAGAKAATAAKAAAKKTTTTAKKAGKGKK
jgi:hypothetical protein